MFTVACQLLNFYLKKGPKLRKKTKMVTPHFILLFQKVTNRLFEANIDSRNGEYLTTPLHIATKKGYIDIAQMLISKGAKIDAKNLSEFTPLHFAAMFGQSMILEMLLKNGANAEAQNNRGTTPLHFALFVNYECLKKSVEMLIEKGAKINARDLDGLTPLHWAALHGLDLTLATLLKNGANIEAETNFSVRPVHIAVELGHYKTVEILIKYGTNLDVKSKEQSPIHFALCHRNQDGFPLLEFVSKMNFNFRCKHD